MLTNIIQMQKAKKNHLALDTKEFSYLVLEVLNQENPMKQRKLVI